MCFMFFIRKSPFGDFTVRVGVIETPPTAWKAVVLPLNYTRKIHNQ